MEIRAWLFISFWSVVSITFLHLGFRALEKTELSYSVSPLVMFMFKHSLAISSCFACSYALKFQAQSKHDVRSNYVLLFYVFFSVIFPRTIEGILIWHALKAIFAWICFLLFKLKIFFAMILRIPSFLFLKIVQFLWKIGPFIGVIVVVVLLCYVPLSSVLSIIYSVTTVSVSTAFVLLCNYMWAYAVSWLFSHCEFVLFYIFAFIGICMALVSLIGCLWLLGFLAYQLVLVCKNNFSELKTRSVILLILELSLFFVSERKRSFSPILVLSISHLISLCWAALSRFGEYTLVSEQSVEGFVHSAATVVAAKVKRVVSMLKDHKAKKFMEFAIGTVGAILFQNFFKITSFSEVAAFLYLAVMWLANLVLLGFYGDFGVFNFLLANAVVGCTVGQFGLHGATWLALGASLLLFALRLKLESLTMAYEEGQLILLSFSDDGSPPDTPLPYLIPI